MNKIKIELPIVNGSTVFYKYEVTGEWKEAFREDNFFLEYSCNIANVPHGILMVPLLANILPMAWVYDAEIVVPICDADFYFSVEEFKCGYRNMYPMINLGGTLIAEELQENTPFSQNRTAALFSGGVDAFCTLIRHSKEKPILITLWGSDVSLNDEVGWSNVKNQLKQVTKSFNVDCVTVKTSFRKFLSEGVLGKKVRNSGDGWWHGFQHGIGIISHTAPIAYAMGLKTVYIASSFTAEDKGKVTCASDPTIDDYIRFCGTKVVHDGYEYTRQDKIKIITNYSKDKQIKIPLRVCWESKGGSNCCHCEKCWRTILGIYATGNDPHDFGFQYNSFKDSMNELKEKRYVLGTYKESLYKPIWTEIRKNYSYWTIDPSLRWFYISRFSELETGTVLERHYKHARKTVGKVRRKIKHFFIRE